MLSTPQKEEIDHRTIKLIVGVVALSLAGLTNVFAETPITSISASYYEAGWSQTIFIGFLFAIAAFLLAYNGFSRPEMVLTKVAAVAGLGVALFPCECDGHDELVPFVHGASAAIMFLILAFLCYGFFQRAREKGHMEANVRATIYAACGISIVASIIVLASDYALGGALTARVPRLTFFGEAAGLISFGFSWLTASRVFPLVTRPDERFSPLRHDNPD